MLCNEMTRLSRGLSKCMWSGFGNEGWLAGSFWRLEVFWAGWGRGKRDRLVMVVVSV